MLPLKCPNCGRFTKDDVAIINGLDDIVRVDSTCKKCGLIHPENWDADDFVNED